MVDAKLCAQHLLLKPIIQIDVGAICYLRVSTTRTWVRIADIGDETVDCVSVQFFASKRQTLCILICDKPVYENVAVKIDVVFLVCNRKTKKR